MSGLKNSDNLCWLLIELLNGSRNVVNVKSLVSPVDEELRPGDVIKLKWRGKQKTATIIALARDRDPLDAMIKGTDDFKAQAGPSSSKSEPSCSRTPEEAGEYLSSGSSWTPSHDEEDSADSDTGDTPVKPKRRHQTSKKIRKCNKRRHQSLTELMVIKNVLPDSFKFKGFNEEDLQNEEYVLGMMNVVKNALTSMFDVVGELNEQKSEIQNSEENVQIPLKAELSKTSNEKSVHEDEEEDGDESNRSTDNDLITNKHKLAEKNEQIEDEWVPIGSGMTLVHRDKFKTVNWRSYTIATRTLLVALFPRSILATHCLTGKSSPAFKDRPPKMCLDPKKISDIIIEIMDRFDVTENLVRSIITTKCADESKMMKMRENKRKSENDENMPPDTDDNSDKENENE